VNVRRERKNVSFLSMCFTTTGEGDRKRSLRSHRPDASENVLSDANGINKSNARTVNHGTNCHENSHFHMNNIKQEGHQFSLGTIKQEPCNTRVSRSVSYHISGFEYRIYYSISQG
jgi:hypothetical protein